MIHGSSNQQVPSTSHLPIIPNFETSRILSDQSNLLASVFCPIAFTLSGNTVVVAPMPGRSEGNTHHGIEISCEDCITANLKVMNSTYADEKAQQSSLTSSQLPEQLPTIPKKAFSVLDKFPHQTNSRSDCDRPFPENCPSPFLTTLSFSLLSAIQTKSPSSSVKTFPSRQNDHLQSTWTRFQQRDWIGNLVFSPCNFAPRVERLTDSQQDITTGDEMVSDTFKIIDAGDGLWEVDCRMITKGAENFVLEGANPSAEGEDAEEGGDSDAVRVLDIEDQFRLNKIEGKPSKKAFQGEIKSTSSCGINV